jgi:hypothetical protein
MLIMRLELEAEVALSRGFGRSTENRVGFFNLVLRRPGVRVDVGKLTCGGGEMHENDLRRTRRCEIEPDRHGLLGPR